MPAFKKDMEHDVEDFFNLSGAGLNRSRKTTPAPSSKTFRNVTNDASELHLDLFNFEDPVFEDSKYVLTSPRSLEACSRLSIKPVELLYKPLIEFQEELGPRGLSMRAIYETFDQEEKERINKLQLCREERERIVEEDERKKKTTVSPMIALSPDQGGRSVTLTGKSTVRELRHSDGVFDDLLEIVETKRRPVDRGSLQRARTAWTTKQDIDQRNLQGQSTMQKKKRSAVSTKATKSTARNKLSGKRKKQQRQLQKQLEEAATTNGDLSPTNNGDANSISSSRASRPWIKDPKADATPITDPTLRDKLTSAKGSRVTTRRSKSFNVTSSSGPLVKQQDQKILKIMLAKREQEKKARERREYARSAWEAEKEREVAARSAGESLRRRSVQEDRRRQIAQRERVLSKKEQSEEEKKRLHEEAAKHCDRNWASASQRQAELKHQKLQEKRLLALERKKSVEERLEQQKREMQELQKTMHEKNERELKRANSYKDAIKQEQAMKVKMRNYHSKKRHEERMSRLKRQSMDELHNLRASFDMKQQSAEQKLQELRKQKDAQLRRQSAELDQRIKASKKNQQKLDEEISAWHEDLLNYRKSHEEKAGESAKEAVLKRKQKAIEDRIHRQKLQKDNLDKIMQQEEDWKADLEAAIALKESRSKMLQNEKEEMIQESRALAHSSQRLREELRQHYSMNDLDKWSKEAELQSRIIDKQVNGITKPMSKVHLG